LADASGCAPSKCKGLAEGFCQPLFFLYDVCKMIIYSTLKKYLPADKAAMASGAVYAVMLASVIAAMIISLS
jgi:hypothetical protein